MVKQMGAIVTEASYKSLINRVLNHFYIFFNNFRVCDFFSKE